MRVEVAAPFIAGESVVFHWTQPDPNPFQQANEFFFRYKGIDLFAFSPLLLLEIFLGLELGVFAVYEKPVEVVLPLPVPQSTVDFWRAYHGAENVSVGPIAGDASYSPWRTDPVPLGDRQSAAVFFGAARTASSPPAYCRNYRGGMMCSPSNISSRAGWTRSGPGLWNIARNR